MHESCLLAPSSGWAQTHSTKSIPFSLSLVYFWLFATALSPFFKYSQYLPQNICTKMERGREMHADWANIIRRTIIMVIILAAPSRRAAPPASTDDATGRQLGIPLPRSPPRRVCLSAYLHAHMPCKRHAAFELTCCVLYGCVECHGSSFS